MDNNTADTIVPADFPELRMLVWNRDATRPISAEEALQIYERNWRFVDAEHLTESEAALVERLARQFGNGVLLTT